MSEDAQQKLNEYSEIYFAFQSIQEKSISKMPEAQQMMLCRNYLEPFVFQFLKKKQGSVLNDFWNTQEIPLQSDKAIVIVERRCVPNLEFVLKNAVQFARGYAVHIFCSQANLDWLLQICGNQRSNIHFHMTFTDIGEPKQGQKEQNHLLCQKSFQETLKEEHLLCMESDSYLLAPIPDSIQEQDQVASAQPWNPQSPGGGGLSYRKRSVMLQICEKYPQDKSKSLPQDMQISEGIQKLGYKYPDSDTIGLQFTEAQMSQKAVGTHQWWTFTPQLSPEDIFLALQKYLTLHL